jgi:site-specific DNA-methyltransferase (adenine-specific)
MTYPRLPELAPEAFAALKASAAQLGILMPVVHTERGETVDGRARERIARELGIKDYPVRTVSGLSAEQRWQMHVALNLQRRQMDRRQKREYVAACLRHAPDLSDRWLAELCGVDGKTVAAVRRELEASAEIPRKEVFRGKDGRKLRFTTVPTESARHTRAAEEALRKLGGQHPGRVIKVGAAAKLAQRAAHERHRSGPAPEAPAGCKIECCDFRKLTARGVDIIFTDPDWGDKTVWGDLGAWAAKALRPSGILCAYTGQAYLPEALEGLKRHLRYHWFGSMVHGAEIRLLHHWRVKNGWVPLVLFSKGPWPKSRYFLDTYFACGKEKDYDEHQQVLGEALYFIETLTEPGALVCDPFGGGFTTAEAALRLHRRFIGCDINPGKVTGGLNRLSKVKT